MATFVGVFPSSRQAVSCCESDGSPRLIVRIAGGPPMDSRLAAPFPPPVAAMKSSSMGAGPFFAYTQSSVSLSQ
jgi:hypothetical protein